MAFWLQGDSLLLPWSCPNHQLSHNHQPPWIDPLDHVVTLKIYFIFTSKFHLLDKSDSLTILCSKRLKDVLSLSDGGVNNEEFAVTSDVVSDLAKLG